MDSPRGLTDHSCGRRDRCRRLLQCPTPRWQCPASPSPLLSPSPSFRVDFAVAAKLDVDVFFKLQLRVGLDSQRIADFPVVSLKPVENPEVVPGVFRGYGRQQRDSRSRGRVRLQRELSILNRRVCAAPINPALNYFDCPLPLPPLCGSDCSPPLPLEHERREEVFIGAAHRRGVNYGSKISDAPQ